MKRLTIGLTLAALTVAAVALAQASVNLSIKFDDATVYDEVEAAVCAHYGYQDTVPDPSPTAEPGATVPNPETRKAFVRRQAKRFLLEHREAYLDAAVAQSAKAAAKAARKAESETP